MVRREEILEIIGSVERRDSPLRGDNTTILPTSMSNWSTREIIDELIKDGFITPNEMGNVFLLGDSGLKVNIALTRKGRLLYERYSSNTSKDNQIIRLHEEGVEENTIANLVDSALAYVKLTIENQQK